MWLEISLGGRGSIFIATGSPPAVEVPVASTPHFSHTSRTVAPLSSMAAQQSISSTPAQRWVSFVHTGWVWLMDKSLPVFPGCHRFGRISTRSIPFRDNIVLYSHESGAPNRNPRNQSTGLDELIARFSL